jgi:hypothetical protein
MSNQRSNPNTVDELYPAEARHCAFISTSELYQRGEVRTANLLATADGPSDTIFNNLRPVDNVVSTSEQDSADAELTHCH